MQQVRNDGECVEVRECPVCSDESGYGRKSGEQWTYSGEPCVVAICQPDGTIAQSSTECAAEPVCGPNEVNFLVFREGKCLTVSKLPLQHSI